MQNRLGKSILGVLALLVLLPSAASAQSTFTGLVRDESGAVLPGVTVEASSPVLIEKSRTVVTDDQGRFRIVDLRPGTYRLTFSLQGFSTVLRDGVDLPSNLVVTVNVDLKVGSLEERVTVSGQAPQVDVQQASRTQVLTRDFLDSLPTTRNSMAIGYLAPGVRMSAPDIGGSNLSNQPGMRAHGVRAPNGVLQLVDGLSIATLEGNQLFYFDESAQSEITVTTSGLPADAPSGGIRINSILRDGGNTVSGDVHLNGTDGDWISDNVTDELRERGIQQSNGVAHVQYFSGALGGPALKNKLWFILGARHASSDTTIANVPEEIVTPRGEILRGIVDTYIRDVSVRMTWQATPKHKFAVFTQRVWKRLGQNFVFGQDPRIGTQRDPHHAHNYLAIAKWTWTPTSQWLIEAGRVASVFNWRSTPAQQDLQKERGTPEWFAFAERRDTALNINPNCAYSYGCTQWMSLTDNRTEAGRMHTMAAANYVTGTHNIKIGFNNNSGRNAQKLDRNADLIQNYVNARPNTVTVFNTPFDAPGWVDYDLGVFAQDSWTIKRLTMNPGLRVEWNKTSMRETWMPAGRFAPERYYPKQDAPAWGPDYLPRVSAVYDLFGDGKTALKASYAKYNEQLTAQDVSWRYADAASSSDTRNWFDCDLNPGTSTCSGRVLPTNGDDIAQNNEIGPSSNARFGLRADLTPAPDLQRMTNTEFTAGVQHQLFAPLAVSAMVYRRTWDGIWRTDRPFISASDYTSFRIPTPNVSRDPDVAAVVNPADSLTIYNLNAAKRGVFGSSQVDYNSNDQSIYNGVELSFNARFVGRVTAFGSWNIERNVSVFCDPDDDPNGTNPANGQAGIADQYQGELVSAGGRFCDQRNFDMPFRQEFKLAGNYSLPLEFSVGAVWLSFPGRERVITYSVPATLFPGGRTNAETIILNEPGSLYYPRYNQLDVNFKKTFRLGNKVLTGQIDLFNALNSNTIWAQNNSVGSSLGVITQTLQGRTPRLAFTLKF